MAIAFDAASQDGGSQTTTQTWTHTVGSGLTDSVAVMIVMLQSGRTVSGTPTFGGSNMTLQGSSWSYNGATFDKVYLYYMVNPSAGANTVSVTSSSLAYVYTVCGTYQGVDQTNPLGSTPVTANNKATTNSHTTSLTTNEDNAWLVGMGIASGGGGVAAGASTTRRATAYASYDWHALLDSNAAKTPTGSYSLIHTGSNVARGTQMTQLKPAGAAPATVLPQFSGFAGL